MNGKVDDSNSAQSYNGQRLAIAVTLFAVIAIFHAFKGLGCNPSLFPDETTYNYGIRIDSFKETPVPNYLYYAVYLAINLFGDSFLNAARIMNAIFFTSASFFIFLIARMLCSFKLALFIAVISVMLPYSQYTVFLMPESLNIFCFWFFSWFVLRERNPISPIFAAYSGAISG